MVVLGDQLDSNSAALDGFDPSRDRIWMAEVVAEATHVWCHKARLVFFFSAMRHFRDELLERGWPVDYHELTADPRRDRGPDFASLLAASLDRWQPERIRMVAPGDWRVRQQLEQLFRTRKVLCEYSPDRHFYLEPEQFAGWAAGKKGLLLENFYRWMRKSTGILMEGGQPVGGSWNYDQENREPFPAGGPQAEPLRSFPPDALTRKVRDMVLARFADHPGSVDSFDYPVTARAARGALDDFVQHRLPLFGKFQDAMWTDQPHLHHSRLSAVMNVKLLSPQVAVAAAVQAWEEGRAPLNAVEGFVRQILGWREYVRGIYWTRMPAYQDLNALACDPAADVPAEFWTGETPMNCVRQAMRGVTGEGYAHHIHRLMVLGLYAQLLGVHPYRFHAWHMAMYADAIDWVSLPNTLGMSQYGDGGMMSTKPYCASGNYIHRMSNYCRDCQFDYRSAVGERACPMTLLYWDFLDRHRERWAGNGRMLYQIRNLERKAPEDLDAIRSAAAEWRARALPS